CTRAWQRGWKTFFEPESRVIHDHKGTIKSFFPAIEIKIIKRKNRFFFLWLHLSTRKLFFSHIPWIFFRSLLRLLKLDVAYAIGLFRALSALRKVIELRGGLQSPKGTKPLEEIIKEIGH
ncbi:hypothetical protein KA005_71340, partial [bacterium]|nr:hypothetical protein [bacterium]